MTPLPSNGTSLHHKGYLVIKSGPQRDQYVHRLVAAAFLGRELRKDEQVHHKDEDKRNCHFSNLLILGTRDHTFVTAKQAYFMKMRDEAEKREWDKFMAQQAEDITREILESKKAGQDWTCKDDRVQEAWGEKL